MKAQLAALYQLQQVDVRIAAVRRELESLNNGRSLRLQLAESEKRLADLSAELRKSETELKDNELNLKSVESKKQSFEQKLYAGQVTNPKELSSMEKEIEILGKTRAKLDERILELYDVVERRQAQVKEAQAVINRLKEELDRQTSEFNAKTKELNSNIEQLNKEREKSLQAITDKPLLSRYETVRARYKDTGLAKVENGKCSGCHVGLTGFTVRKLKEDGQYQTCESCGRILYVEE